MIASLQPSSTRLLHSFIRRYNRRVGPPDPVSNLRPTIYDDFEPESSASHTSPRTTIHPYSLFEFRGPDASCNSELHWKLHRQQLDAFDQAFWSNNNSRFEVAKAEVLSNLPESSPALDIERALSKFNKHWLIQESERMDNYTTEWRRRNLESLILESRVKYNRFVSRIAHIFKFRS